MANTFYTPFQVLQSFCAEKGYTIVNFTVPTLCREKCMVWVSENSDEVTRLFCKQETPTTFVIIAFGGLYDMKYITAKDYSDVNTPPLME